MKSKSLQLRKLAVFALMPAAMLVFTSCSSTPEGESASLVTARKGVPGGILVDTYQTTATVTGIDSVNRKVTLVTPQGKKSTYTAGPEVVNFDQIRIGDQLRIRAVDELVVYLAGASEPARTDSAALVALAPVGAKPGALMSRTMETTAIVTELDHKKHQATLKFADGTSRKFAVRKDVDLKQRKVGEAVVIRSTEAIAITVEKP